VQLRLNTDNEATENKFSKMNAPCPKQEDQELYEECLEKAEGDKARALAYYNHRRNMECVLDQEDLDNREKWPMLTPLLILYTLGTIGVLILVYWYLSFRLGW
jgi:hypothetical protein